MKKTIIFIPIILLIILSFYYGKTYLFSKGKTLATNMVSSIDKTALNPKIIINEHASGENGTFYLGMSKQDACSILDAMKIEYDGIEITNDRNNWDYGNRVLIIQTKNLDFTLTFDKKDNLYLIWLGKNIPTTLGLKLGDSLDDMEKLYGKNYSIYKTKKDNIYEYSISDHYFRVLFSIKTNKVESWQISKYKFDKK